MRRGVGLTPQSSLGRLYLALVLDAMGRFDEALDEAANARQIDPLSPFVLTMSGGSMIIAGPSEESLSYLCRALDLQPGYLFAMWALGLALCQLRRTGEALNLFKRIVAVSQEPCYLALLGMAYGLDGRIGEAQGVLSTFDEREHMAQYIPAFARYFVTLGFGDTVAVRESFARAIEERTPPLTLPLIPGIVNFRTDPEIDRMHREFFGR